MDGVAHIEPNPHPVQFCPLVPPQIEPSPCVEQAQPTIGLDTAKAHVCVVRESEYHTTSRFT